MSDSGSPLLYSLTAMRLVLVHLLAQFPDTLRVISEGADTDITTLEDLDLQRGENWMAPYR